LEDEIRVLHGRLAEVGQYVTYSPGPNSNPNLDEELRRWLATSPNADAASGFRAGWTRLARYVGPKLLDRESRWQMRGGELIERPLSHVSSAESGRTNVRDRRDRTLLASSLADL
jgi:hypothetical protein